MLVFLYTGFAAGFVFISFLFYLDEIKVRKKNIKGNGVFKYFAKKIPGRFIVFLIILVIISFGVPYTIWATGEKETSISEKVVRTRQINYDVSKDCYVKVKKSNGKIEYLVDTIGDSSEKYNGKDVEIVDLKTGEKPKVCEIERYQLTKLKKRGFFYDLVNNMFTFGLEWNEKFLDNKIKIYVSDASIKEI